MSTVPQVDSDVLVKLMQDKTKKAGQDYVVVDVRDHDYRGGNIVNAINLPSKTFRHGLPEFAKKYGHVPLVFFHCMQSQTRGPKAARIYQEYVDDHNMSQKVMVLRGGFQSWVAQFMKCSDLVTNYDPSVWE
ncbi:Rhodanese-like domain-containing protein [Radiomyces spectabilis]|uniref:Rhodanese-like domain-containing protein n=1 Tax=Radiomyces spectabilis TaxID=64574 RepID=UPI00221FC1D6|nr:Rhodanese-like domain-containing protein [Radiomyces spectabilis]KAI8369244.1 Rhodanese-like domain-containing protein [Radiomyces spectabilis]